ncbi:MAG: DUF2156 domain-containing protein [Clostridia bacterium]|nr:DUF2156 domain-containing protein [Clostridia bacterium]
MNFEKLALNSPVRSCFAKNSARTCDYVWGTLQMWRDYFDMSYTQMGESVLVRLDNYRGSRAYLCPRGARAEEILRQLSLEDPHPRFCFVPEEALSTLRSVFPACEITEEPDWFDYLYDAKTFYAMSGKRYHGPKNHVNKFARFYPNAQFTDSPSTEELSVFLRQMEAASTRDDPMARAEYSILEDMLLHREAYGMIWGALRVNGILVAVSAAEILDDTMYVHVEKANTEYLGAYQAIARAMAGIAVEKEIPYINREEDLGDPGLRRSKQGYNPIALLKKYTVQI